jgi:hypothetical protein
MEREPHIEIDERWLTDYFEFGFAELTSHLGKIARFQTFCERREAAHAA